MITILNGKLTIPERERFIGFAGDNLKRTIEFLICGATEADRIYRLYLTFDDETEDKQASVNYFVLPSKVTDEGVVLTWNVLSEHIFKSGNVKAQIKGFSDKGEIYHTTTDTFIVGDSAEFSGYFTTQNTEFLDYERRLNELLQTVSDICVLTPYIGNNGNWYIYDSSVGEYTDSGRPSVGEAGNQDIAAGAVTADKIAYGAIDNLSHFSYDIREAYFSLPLRHFSMSGALAENFYNTLTEPAIYQVDTMTGTHEVVIVLKPRSTAYLMQIRLSYNKVMYRGIRCASDGVYADEDWEDWCTLTGESITVDSALDAESQNPVQNKVVSAALEERMRQPEAYSLVSDFGENSDPQFVLYQDTDPTSESIHRIAWSTLLAKAKSITDSGEYYVSDTVDGALQEVGETLKSLDAYDTADVVKMNITQSALSAEHGKLLANINDNTIFSCTAALWDDIPTPTGCIFINQRYGSNYNLQIAIQVGDSNMWHRIVNRNTHIPYRNWSNKNGNAPLKILAIGDSICYGSRNGNRGFVGGLGLNYKNAGVSGATLSNIITSVTNIPDQLEEETDYEPDIIIADGGVNDYYNGASLGTLSAVPVSTDAQAESIDRSTIIGGLEYLFYKMATLHPAAQRFFVITHKTYATAYSGATAKAYWPTAKNQAGYTQQDMHDAIVKCCEAYNVKVIDVYAESMINTLFSEYRSEIAYSDDNSVTNTEFVDSDGIHPLAYGYLHGYEPIVRKAIGIGTVK